MKKGYTNFEDLSTNLENVLTFREFKDTYLKILRLIINEGYQRDF